MTAARLLALAALLVPVASTADAQTPPAPPAPHACFRGAPGDRCTWFPLVEAGIHYRLTDVIPGDERVLINWSLGAMVNRGSRTAIGGALFASLEGEFRAGANLRWRRWLSHETSVELGAGVHLAGDFSNGEISAGSPTFQARLNYGDQFTATARVDVLKRKPCDTCSPSGVPDAPPVTSTRLYLGAELGSYPGLVGYLATGVLFTLALLSGGPTYAF
jgi:hypothetical protein